MKSVAVALAAIACAALVSQARETAEGATQLFNGQDLAGWGYFLVDDAAAMEDVWSVRDGVLVCQGSPQGYLCTEDEYEDFHLVVEWRWPGTATAVLMPSRRARDASTAGGTAAARERGRRLRVPGIPRDRPSGSPIPDAASGRRSSGRAQAQ